MQFNSIQKRKAFYAAEVMKQRFDQGKSITAQDVAAAIGLRWMQQVGVDAVYPLIRWLHTNGNLPGLISDKRGYSRATNTSQLIAYQNRLKSCRNGFSARLGLVEQDLRRFKLSTI